MIATKLRVIPLVVLCACMENGLYPGEDAPGKPGPNVDSTGAPVVDDDPIADADRDGADDPDDPQTPTARLSGTVTVIPTAKDADGRLIELDWDEVGPYPYGGIWVDAFTPGMGGKPRYLAQTALLTPTTGPNPWSLELPEGTFTMQAVLDEANDRIIGIAEPSGLWRERLEVRQGVVYGEDGRIVEDIDLFVSVPTALPGGGGSGGDGGEGEEGGGRGDPTDDGGDGGDTGRATVWVSGDARVGLTAGEDCAAMLFSANRYGPYYWTFYQRDELAKPTWSMEVLAGSGPMRIATACDANWNGLLDPADAWGTWVAGLSAQNPVRIADRDIEGIGLRAPFLGAFSTAEPTITLTGAIADPMGFDAYPAGAVLYLVAQRGDGAPDPGTLDHEYAWTKVLDPSGRAVPFSLTVPAWKETTVWAWVDLDGDGVLNEPGEPGGASGPWYTDQPRDALQITVRPASG